jgi:hypothetical protein
MTDREAQTSHVFTLVHGTWVRAFGISLGRPGAWTRDEGPVCQELRKRFGLNTVISRFEWSGDNSHSARGSSSARFSEHVTRVAAEHRGAIHCVVAHSHGGNVVLEALKRGSDENVQALVCLATPFLSHRAIDIAVSVTWTLIFLYPALMITTYFLSWLGCHCWERESLRCSAHTIGFKHS